MCVEYQKNNMQCDFSCGVASKEVCMYPMYECIV